MIKQQGEYQYIIPGEETWEIWTHSQHSGLKRQTVTETTRLSEVPLSSGSKNVLFFPINTLSFSPIKVETTDASLFEDLIDNHWEIIGLKSSEEDGILNDYNKIDEDENSTILGPFVLEPQKEDDLPKGRVSYFDISPDLYKQNESKVIIRKELGFWTLSYYIDGKVFYALQLGKQLDHQSLLDARLMIIQLSMQGCCPSTVDVEIWVSENEAPFDYSKIHLGASAKTKLPQDPTLPSSFSKLLPADVGAERRKQSRKKKIVFALTVGALLYVAGIGYLGFKLYQLDNEVTQTRVAVRATDEEIQILDDVQAKWQKYKTTVDSQSWPDEILWKCYNAMPDKKAIRFLNFEIKSDEATGRPAGISIRGTAPTPELITKFSQQLKNPQFQLDSFEWNTPNPQPPAKDKPVWSFSFEATVKDLLPPQ